MRQKGIWIMLIMESSVYTVTGELTNDGPDKNDCDNIFLAFKNILLYSVLAMHVFSGFHHYKKFDGYRAKW